MLKSIITLIVTLIVGVVFMAIGNDFLNGSTDLGVIVAVAVAGALVVFFTWLVVGYSSHFLWYYCVVVNILSDG